MRLPYVVSILCLVLIASSAAPCDMEYPAFRELTLWLILSRTPAVEEGPVANQIQQFNDEFGDRCPVTVLNTTDLSLRMDLLTWNPELAGPIWPFILGQRDTLRALHRFAGEHHVHLSVRFMTWSETFEALQTAVMGGQRRDAPRSIMHAPDVAEIGTTWTAHFAKYTVPLHPPLSLTAATNLVWHEPYPALRYTTDLRLLFYWKRLPEASMTTRPLQIDASNWQAIINSLKNHLTRIEAETQPPMIIPIGRSYNLLHDYVPFLRSGEGTFLHEQAPFRLFLFRYADLRSPKALRFPHLLAENASQRDDQGRLRHLISFPDMSNQEALRHFLDGKYLAISTHVSFLRRWHAHFVKIASAIAENSDPSSPPKHFWDYAGVTALPAPYQGGSDLIVVRGTKKYDTAFALAQFLAMDKEHTQDLAKIGQLPAHLQDFGVDILLTEIEQTSNGDLSVNARACLAVFRRMAAESRRHPDFADWPIYIEDREVREAMQRLWWRIAEGNTARVTQAASEVEELINLRVYFPKWLWSWVKIPLLLGSVIGSLLFANHRRQLGKQNRLLSITIDIVRLRDHVGISRAGQALSDAHRMTKDALQQLSTRLAELRDKTLRLEADIRDDLKASGHRPVKVSSLLEQAWETAASKYAVAYPSRSGPLLQLCLDRHLNGWQVNQWPHILVALTQEWLYNCMKACSHTPGELSVKLWYHGCRRPQGIQIVSPTLMTREHIAPLLPVTLLRSKSQRTFRYLWLLSVLVFRNSPSAFTHWWGRTSRQTDDLVYGTGPGEAFTLMNNLCGAAFSTRLEYWWRTDDEHLIFPRDRGDTGLRSALIIVLPMTRRKEEHGDAGCLDR